MIENNFTDKKIFSEYAERPNVMICDTRREGDGRLAELLMREEINVFETKSLGNDFLANAPANGWHMAVIRDGGIAQPAFDELARIRSNSDIPIITVSDECSEIYRIMALSKGADACMDAGKFGAYEFKARIVSMLRRSLRLYAPGTCGRDVLRNGDITINRRRREVFSCGVKIRLTAIEYGIVEYLMENCGSVCAIDDIYREVWHENPFSVRKTVVEHIRRIRCKLEPDPHNPCYIKAVFGVGYKMERAG